MVLQRYKKNAYMVAFWPQIVCYGMNVGVFETNQQMKKAAHPSLRGVLLAFTLRVMAAGEREVRARWARPFPMLRHPCR
jgi:hypothetical protein